MKGDPTRTPTGRRRCAACRKEDKRSGGDVQLCVVRDAASRQLCMRAFLCREHRAAQVRSGNQVLTGWLDPGTKAAPDRSPNDNDCI